MSRYFQQFFLQWAALDSAARIKPSTTAARAEVVTLYVAPERHYHTLTHANQVLVLTRALIGGGDYIAAAYAAIYHDAVYDPARGDNEELSAALAELHLTRQGASPGMIAEVRRLILATRHAGLQPDSDWAGKVLCDADLSVLGADADAYAEYSAGIRREYGYVPDDAYRVGRTKVLESFLQRERIFQTALMQSEYEAQARRNLAAEISAL